MKARFRQAFFSISDDYQFLTLMALNHRVLYYFLVNHEIFIYFKLATKELAYAKSNEELEFSNTVKTLLPPFRCCVHYICICTLHLN